ncbi:MAG: iron ABC transporter permease [Myxococcota bacterium]
MRPGEETRDQTRGDVAPGRRPWLTGGVLLLAAVPIVAAALVVGTGTLDDVRFGDTFLALRLQRLAAAFLAGAALASGGVVVQGLFRNPLASPSILGTNAGAALGGQSALLAAELVGIERVAPELLVPFGCLVGAFGSLAVLLTLLRITDDLLALLLTGFALSALFLSLSAFVTSLAQETFELGRAVVSFSLGGVAGAGRPQLALALPLVLVGFVAAAGWGRTLDLLLSGEEEARSLGVDVPRVRLWAAVWTSVLVAGAVSVGGNVSFVGLVVPHALRPFAGVAHRQLLPLAAIAGGLFVVLADVVARALPAQGEVPLGVVTGLIGAPLFLGLLARMRRELTA